MSHVTLIGDSVFDNASYTKGGPDVVSHLRGSLPPGWRATLCAVDGSTTEEISEQLPRLPPETTHLVLSVGGNNAILSADILDRPVALSGEAFQLLFDLAASFETQYRRSVEACLTKRLPLTVCTIYHGNFEDETFRRRAIVALTLFNDAIIRTAVANQLTIIDLRLICNSAVDFANPIEPSAIGGAKIARAILQAITSSDPAGHGARIL